MDRFAVLLDAWSNEMLFLQCKKEVRLASSLRGTYLPHVSREPCRNDAVVMTTARKSVSIAGLKTSLWQWRGVSLHRVTGQAGKCCACVNAAVWGLLFLLLSLSLNLFMSYVPSTNEQQHGQSSEAAADHPPAWSVGSC